MEEKNNAAETMVANGEQTKDELAVTYLVRSL